MNILLTTIIYRLMEFQEIKEWFAGFVLLTLIITPFILIISFIFSLFWALIGLISKPDLQLKKVYVVILSCTTLYLTTQGFVFLTILNFRDLLPAATFTVLSLLSVILVFLAMFSGFTNIIGFSKKFSVITLSSLFAIIFIINIIQLIGGNPIGSWH